MENTWQVCPKCDGNKSILQYGTTSAINTIQCSVCNGFGILSKETGLPPNTNGELFTIKRESEEYNYKIINANELLKYNPPITKPLPNDKSSYKFDICRSIFVKDPTVNPSQKFEDAYPTLSISKETNLEG